MEKVAVILQIEVGRYPDHAPVPVTDQDPSQGHGLSHEEDVVALGQYLNPTQNLLGHRVQDPGHLGLHQGHGRNAGEAGLGLVPVVRGDGDLGQGHVIVQASREGEGPVAPTHLPAPGRGHIQETISIPENSEADNLDGS